MFVENITDLLESASKAAFDIMVEQMNTNPEAIEALYGTAEKERTTEK